MSQAIEVFATLRPDLSRFGREAQRGIAAAMPMIAKAAVAGMAVVGGSIAAAATKGIRAFSGFERQMNEVFTLLPGITDDAMDRMSSRVLAFAREFGTLPEEVVPALYQALSAGVPEDNVFDFLETAQKAAIGGITDLETAVDGISSVVNAYGSEVLSAAEASDIMFTGVRIGKTDFQQLSDRLFQVVPVAQSLGIEFGDVAAALATITAQGTPTRVAATQLRSMFNELGDSSREVSATFEQIAGKSFPDFIASGGNVQDALQLLEDHAETSGVRISDLFGSVEAGQAALGLTGQATRAFTDALAEMGTSAGATEAAYEQMDQGLSRAMDKIRAGWEVIKIAIGENLAPLVERFADWVISTMPEIEAAVASFFAGLESAAESAASAFSVALDAWSDFRSGFTEDSEQTKETLAGLRSDFNRLSSTISEMADSADADQDRLGVTWEAAGRDFNRFVDATLEEIAAVVRGIDWLGRQWNAFTADVSDLLDELVEMKQKWRDRAAGLMSEIGGFFGRLRDEVEAAMLRVGASVAGFVSDVRSAADAIRSQIDRIVDWFKALPGRIVAGVGDLRSTLVEKGKDLIGGFTSGIRSAIPGVGDAIDGAWRGMQIGGMFTGPGGGGSALATVRQAMQGIPGLRITSTYRSPAHNRRVGGAPNSLHMDRNNPAVDIGGPTASLDALAARLRQTSFRQLIWRAPGHWDHVHYAHQGGRVSPSWPTLPGLKHDERPAVLRVGEEIMARGGDGAAMPVEISLHIDGREFARATGRHTRDELRSLDVSLS